MSESDEDVADLPRFFKVFLPETASESMVNLLLSFFHVIEVESISGGELCLRRKESLISGF